MRPLIAIALTLTVFGIAACSGDDDADPTTTATATTATVVETTESDDTTSTVATTSSTSPSTSIAPTTTIDPTEALIADIEADLNAGEQAMLAGAADPASAESRTNLESYFTDEALARYTEFYDSLVEQGLVARPSESVPSVIVVLSLADFNGTDHATVDICRIDAGVVVERLPDGREAVVDDSVTRYDTRVQMTLTDGVWRSRGGGEALGSEAGVTTCD